MSDWLMTKISTLDYKSRYLLQGTNYVWIVLRENKQIYEIKNVCAFVPTDFYDENKGYFVIFQSASSGECIRPEMV